jgi:hypothetical protein
MGFVRLEIIRGMIGLETSALSILANGSIISLMGGFKECLATTRDCQTLIIS